MKLMLISISILSLSLYLYFDNVIKILQFNDIFMTTPVSQETLEEI